MNEQVDVFVMGKVTSLKKRVKGLNELKAKFKKAIIEKDFKTVAKIVVTIAMDKIVMNRLFQVMKRASYIFNNVHQ